MGADRTVSIAGESLHVRYCQPDGFIAGIDNGLIRLHRYLGARATASLPHVDDIGVDAVFAAGQLGRTHVLNVSAEDPGDYSFVTYGLRVGLEDGASYEGMCLRDGRTRVMSELAYADYHRAKRDRTSSLSLLHGFFSGRMRQYRRLICPLVGDRGKVTHLLVSVTPNLDQVPAGAFDDVSDRRLVAENPLDAAGGRKVALD